MILEFSVQNFRSIKELQTISLMATKLDSNSKKNPEIDSNNIAIVDGLRVLKTIGIYGANGSGKSNIILALIEFIKSVANLPSSESQLDKLNDPYRYQEDYQDTESFFQVVILLNEKRYRYGFTIKRNSESKQSNEEKSNYSKHIITNEWLFGPREKNQVMYFSRKGQTVDEKNIEEKNQIPKLPYRHSLYISHAAAYDNGIYSKIRNYFRESVTTNFLAGSDRYRFHTIRYINDIKLKLRLIDFLASFNISYDDIILEDDAKEERYSRFEVYPDEKISFLKKYTLNNAAKSVTLNLRETESAGTRKLFDIAGLILLAFSSSKRDGVMIMDELDSNFHPNLVINLVNLFNNKEVNKSNCQLIFTSHETTLMNPSIMRRDQFYFTEKYNETETKMYSLSDLKGIRNDADFAKQYLTGIYGGVPSLHDLINNQTRTEDGDLES
jgi:AAA15 family ATPase/GTPase